MELIVKALPWAQIVLSVLLVGAILLQRSGTDSGGAFGGDGVGSLHHTKRGIEKTLFILTIVLAILFAVSAFATLILS